MPATDALDDPAISKQPAMDFGHPDSGAESPFDEGDAGTKKPKALPADLPTSLDDRRMVREPVVETEMYDGWQGARRPYIPSLEFVIAPPGTRQLTSIIS